MSPNNFLFLEISIVVPETWLFASSGVLKNKLHFFHDLLSFYCSKTLKKAL